MKTKLKLEGLKVQSFTTSLSDDAKKNVKGGASLPGCLETEDCNSDAIPWCSNYPVHC